MLCIFFVLLTTCEEPNFRFPLLHSHHNRTYGVANPGYVPAAAAVGPGKLHGGFISILYLKFKFLYYYCCNMLEYITSAFSHLDDVI